MEKISIVTPSYNSEPFLERTILSVKNQDYPNFEHIVVDSSPEKPMHLVKKYPHITWVLKEERCLQSKALNLGFKKVTGDIVGWINSDDVYEPGAFKAAAEYLGKHPEADMVYSDCRFIDDNDKEIMVWKTAPFSYFRNLNYAQMIPQQTIFFRKSVFDRVGYINEKYDYAMDYDFLTRVSKKCKIVYLPGLILSGFRLHSNSKTMAQRKRFEPEVIQIRKEHGAVVPYPFVRLAQDLIGVFKKRP